MNVLDEVYPTFGTSLGRIIMMMVVKLVGENIITKFDIYYSIQNISLHI